jgi:hypothetical protein
MDKVLTYVKDYVHKKFGCRRVGKRPGTGRYPPVVELREQCCGTKLVGNAALLPTLRAGTTATQTSYSGSASISTKATVQGVSVRLLQAWLVPRWIRMSPAFNSVSPSSINA